MANAQFEVDAGLWEDGSPAVSGVDLRRGGLVSLVGTSAPLALRGGVRPARGTPLGVTLPGGMFIRIQPGVCVVPTTSEGGYVVTNPTQQDLAVTAANATNPRIDTFGCEVLPGSPTSWRFRMLDGTAAASPVAPTYAGAGVFLALADVRTNAAQSAPFSVTDRRQFTVGPGAVIPRDGLMALAKATRDSAAAALAVGTMMYDDAAHSLNIVSADRSLIPVGISEPVFITGSITGPITITNTTPTGSTSTIFNFTPARSGWAYIGFSADIQGVSAGWVAADAVVALNAVNIVDGAETMFYEDVTTRRDRYQFASSVPVWLTGGVAQQLYLVLSRAGGAGSWRINSMTWKVTQP